MTEPEPADDEEQNDEPAECIVCGDPVDPEADKYDDEKPVYSDDGPYHRDCEEEVFEEVYAEVPEPEARPETDDPEAWVRNHPGGFVSLREFVAAFGQDTLRDLTPEPLRYIASEDIVSVEDATHARVQKAPAVVSATLVTEETTVETREGELKAYPGDVLMRGVEGEVYPCDGEIFAKTYVPYSPDSLDLFRETTPEGVEITYEDDGETTLPTGVHVNDSVDLTPEEEEAAEAFVEDYTRAFPFLHREGL